MYVAHCKPVPPTRKEHQIIRELNYASTRIKSSAAYGLSTGHEDAFLFGFISYDYAHARVTSHCVWIGKHEFHVSLRAKHGRRLCEY